jgi:regulator of sigma E protease
VTWLLVVFGFVLLIVLHELGHFTAAKAVGMRVERFSLFFPPTLAKKKIGETEYAIGAIPAGGYVKISGMSPDENLPDEVRDRAYHAQPVWKRIVVIAAGPLVNFVLAFLLLVLFFAAIGPESSTHRLGAVERGFPAHGVLQKGDRLIKVDGRGGSPEAFSQRIQSHKCAGTAAYRCKATSPATLLIERDGKRQTVRLKPIYDDRTARVGDEPRTRLGFQYAPGARQTLSLGHSISVSASNLWFITKATTELPARLFHEQQRKEISGVVGISKVAHDTILSNLADALSLLAVVSLSLAVVNLFPFLPLDGGHIFWAIVEKVRRKPVPIAVMERAGVIGFMLVIGIFLLGLTNDIGRLTGEGFQVR